MAAIPDTPWMMNGDETVRMLEVDPEQGLTSREAEARRKKFGPNRISRKKSTSIWTILFNQFQSVIVLLLSAAAVATFVVGRWVEGIAVSVVMVFNALIGFITELRAVRSMEALKKLSRSMCTVRRNGRISSDSFLAAGAGRYHCFRSRGYDIRRYASHRSGSGRGR